MTKIYVITNTINNKRYVGKTVNSLQYRFNGHCRSRSNMFIHNAITKYGRENFTIELLLNCLDSDWQYWETYYINSLGTHYTMGGYNVSWGGDSNPMDDELSKCHHWDACHSQEFIQKQIKASTGRYHTEKSKQKMSMVQKEIYFNNDALKNRIKMAQPTREVVYCLDDENNIVKKFESISDACRFMGKKTSMAGKLKTFIDQFNKNGKRAKFWGYSWTKGIE